MKKREGLWRSRPRRGTRGATMIEATLVLLFLFALIFLLMDLSWAVFTKVTLQNAVRAGARFAVTSQTGLDSSGNPLGQLASIKQVIKSQAMGLLSDQQLAAGSPCIVCIRFFTVGGSAPTPVSGPGSNAGGNLVMVSVEGYPLSPFAPLLRSTAPVTITVRAGDLLEASPITGPPPL